MGYRSEIFLAIQTGVTIPPAIQTALDEVFGEPFRVHPDGVLYRNDYIKWYPDEQDYPEVYAIGLWLSDDLEQDGEFVAGPRYDQFQFLRLGEDDGDQERNGDWDSPWELGYRRYLVWKEAT